MKKIFVSVLTMYTISGFFAQEVVWQKDIPSPTQNFLSQVTSTIDNQYLITGSSIRPVADPQTGENYGYDYKVIKLNQSGEEIWEKKFSGKNHDYLAATVNTQEGGFLLAGTSWSNKGLDKKRIQKAVRTSGLSASTNLAMSSGRGPLVEQPMKKRGLLYRPQISVFL
uniref:DUF4136 domain-containing protein n=1 Tax=Chryseobacterium endophyticum TaxID=1854762 RepID=A0AAU6WS26_9FLAO